MTATTNSSSSAPVLHDPRAAQAVEAFRDALLRMRDGEELTTQDLDKITNLLQMVQAPTGASLAAEAMPHFREVFHGVGSSAPASRAGESVRVRVTDVVR
ncbi:hypothetical protein [Streptomyces lydicus]|uniref:hypothetical protein n=1 Tax=Streptomyces lydicus TaxID=47763 RepID=UPI0036F062B6